MRSCLIADDHALMRGALAALVAQRWPDAEIVEAINFPETWKAAAALELPALCLIDLDMPGAAPRVGVEGVRSAAPDAAILVITGIEDDRLMRDLLAAGVSGFAQKSASPEILCAAIDLVLAGGRYLPPRVAQLLQVAVIPAITMTDRQRQVIHLIAQGRSNKQIALDLGLSPATVKTHVAHVLAVTGATNRTEAAVIAREAGLI